MAAFEPGEVVADRFLITRYIARGGMGEVYEATDQRLGAAPGHALALKTVRSASPAAIAQLKAEFRARANLHHPHLLELFDLFVDGDGAFFTMELVTPVDFRRWAWGGGAPAGGDSLQGAQYSDTALASDETSGVAAPVRKGPRILASPDAQHRIVRGAAQVLAALRCLHDAGLVHRDVKPGNILVDHDDRVLVSDFGLAQRISREPGAPPPQLDVAGTPAYMAPEQLSMGLASPEADLYGVGATLHEALTGSLPAFDDRPPLDPIGAIDPRLVVLVDRLLAADPRDRPSSHEAIALLQAVAASSGRAFEVTGGELARAPSVRQHFVGRAGELALLSASFAEARRRKTTSVVQICGPSGIGKTGLLRRFLEDLASEQPDLVVLRGRCHPHEQLVFGGLDGVVGDLALHLDSAYDIDVTGVRGASVLIRLFPVLGRVLPVTSVRLPAASEAAQELRRIAFAALRELLQRVARARPLAVWIDDLQWADGDTIDLLKSLLAVEGVAGATFLTSSRDPDRLELPLQTRRIELGPLSVELVGSLLRDLLPPSLRSDAEALTRLAESTGGSPLFAQVLAREKPRAPSVDRDAGDGDQRLAGLINRGVDALPPDQRALADIISVSAVPISLALLVEAAPPGCATQGALRSLEHVGIVSFAPGESTQRLIPFHDRVRQARLQSLDAPGASRLHRALAEAHERLRTGDLDALVHHWHAAGEGTRAAPYAIAAGDRALASLAFASAASSYARAIDWLPDRERPWELHAKLGEALANQGVGHQAAAELERASSLYAPASHGAELATARLRVRAAEQYLHSGRVLDGYRLLREVLARLGVNLPRSNRGCIAWSILLRTRFVMRGAGFTPVADEQLGELERLRLDALWIACTGLAHVNHALADVLLLRHVHAALAAGEPSRLVRSLSYEAAAEATVGGRLFERRGEVLFARVERLLVPERRYDHAWVSVSRAAMSFFRADFRAVVEAARQAARHFDEVRVGTTWERSVNHAYWLSALALMADVPALAERQRLALADAEDRGDALAANHSRSGYAAMLWLFRDEVEVARAEATRVLDAERFTDARRDATDERWPEDSFRTPDYHNLVAATQLDLYVGDACAAYARIVRTWPHLERALLLRVQFVGADLRYLLGRTAIAAAAQLEAGGGPPEGSQAWNPEWTPRALRRVARRQAAALRRDGNACAAPYSSLLDASLAAGEGDRTRARLGFARAADGFEGRSMHAHAAAARHRAGELLAGADGARERSATVASLVRLGAVKPERVIALLVPAP